MSEKAETTVVNGALGSAWPRLLLGGVSALALTIAAGPALAQTVSIDNDAHEIVDGSDPDRATTGTQPSPWIINSGLVVGRYDVGELTVTNGGKVTTAFSSIIGNLGASTGTVTVSGTDGNGNVSTWENSGHLYVGDQGSGALTVMGGGRVTNRSAIVGNSSGSTGAVEVSGSDGNGNASTWEASGSLSIGDQGSGELTVKGGGKVTSRNGWIGYSSGSTGAVVVSGSDGNGNVSTWEASDSLFIGVEGFGQLTVADGGRVDASTVHIGIDGSGNGTLNLFGSEAGGRGVLETGYVARGRGAAVFTIDGGVLRANGDEIDYLRNFRAGDVIVGAGGAFIDSNGFNIGIGAELWGLGGLTKIGSGTLTLSGMNSYTGVTTVEGGTLLVNGNSGHSAHIVNAGATLGGIGTVGSTTVQNGGTLAPGSDGIGALTVNGHLTLSSGSILDFELGSPGASAITPGTSDRIDVTGDLALNGTLNLAQSGDPNDGPAGIGYYRLMTYGGELTGSGLSFGDMPTLPGVEHVGILSGDGRVDLYLAPSSDPGDYTLQHWQGGDGVWSAANAAWLNLDGNIPVIWAGNHAVFKNQPGGFNGGTISVEGTQSFKGLQFVDEGYRLRGSGTLATVAEGSEIRVLADSAEIATEITGAGGIVKTQAGTLILSGHNTYAGGTRILGGKVQVSEDANLGAASGGLTIDGGVLSATGSFDTGRSVTLSGAGTFEVTNGNTLGLTGTIGGKGDLVKRGDGTLLLSGDNAYGNTIVEAGTLTGDVGSISGSLANAGVVRFDQGGDARFAGDIVGLGGTNGKMVKAGAGTLTLGGASTLDWTISEGRLATEAARFAGGAHLDGAGTALSFGDAGSAVYGGAISGNGQFSFEGTGTVLLTGDSSDFAGRTNIGAGTLLVGDADGNGALGGSFNVLDGATLGGSGTVGSGTGSLVVIASGGTLSPGNSIGSLTVDGNLVFEAGSRFAVEVNPEGNESDLVTVTGTATLDGGSVAHIGANGNYDIRSSYTILSAGGGLSGSFNDVTSNFAFLTPELIYDYGAGSVDLRLSRNDRDFASAAVTRNQIATAGGVESIGFDAGHAVYDAIAQLADDGGLIRASFDALSGEIHGSAKTALVEDSRFIRNAANDRIRAAFGDAGAPVAPVLAYGRGDTPMAVSADHIGPVFWSRGFGSWGSSDSDGNAASLDRNTGGLLIGADGLVGDWRLGLLAGYSHSSFKAGDRASSGSSDNYHLGFYGGTQWGNIALRTGAAYSWHDIGTSRAVAIPGLSDRLAADYSAGTFQAFGELGYRLEPGNGIRLEPFAGLAHVSLHTNGFTERGGDAALTGHSGSTDVTFTTLGLRGEHTLTFGMMEATLKGMIGWRHAFGDTTPESTHLFTAGGAFTIAGVPVARDSAVIEAGLDFNISPEATLGLSYTGQIASGAQDHGFKANLAVRF
ncbi:autotransporter domain-containing protein [Brucella pseudintermedia]|uniref:autotransporter domain-containing protein n=1 Tax=Brucella pseudintermedia TaxID=370111 RepID=UPI00142EDFBA|nr:autotransporter domain-containing protein [Brucella pseudintermedia]